MTSKLTDKELLEEVSGKLRDAQIIRDSKEKALLSLVKKSAAVVNVTDDRQIRRMERRVNQANKRVKSLNYIVEEMKDLTG